MAMDPEILAVKFREGHDGETEACHIVLDGLLEAVCGKPVVKYGMSVTMAEVEKTLDVQDYGWHWCGKCASGVSGEPVSYFEEWKY